MMKSTTFNRSAVSASGVTEMSTWFDASTGTLVSWLTGTASSFTLKRLAYSLASSHAGPLHASPRPVVFSTSQGAFASTPTRSTPAFLMASIRGLAPGAGTGTSAKAGAHNASASSSAKLRSMHLDMVPPERPACTGIYGWLVTIIGEAVRRVKRERHCLARPCQELVGGVLTRTPEPPILRFADRKYLSVFEPVERRGERDARLSALTGGQHPKGRILGQSLGVVGILVARQAAVDRLAEEIS